MASTAGAQHTASHAASAANIHAQIAKAATAEAAKKAAEPARTTGAKQLLPLPASLAHLASHDTVSSLGQASRLHDTVSSARAAAAHTSGFDTVTSLGQEHAVFAGGKQASVEKVVATQTVHKDGVTVHFADGSSIHIAGITHLHGGFFHH